MKAAQNRSGYERVGAGSAQSGTGIDRHVYALYGLIRDEIKIIEEAVK